MILLFLRRGYLKRTIARNAVRKGLVGGSGFWRAVWLYGAVRAVRAKASTMSRAPIVIREQLAGGQASAMVQIPEKKRRILSAPDAARINQILGADSVSDPSPTRSQRRVAKRSEKAAARATTRTGR